MNIVYLTPRASFKTQLRSDTIFGLMCWGIEQVHGKNYLEDLLAAFHDQKPPFLISSAFPYRNDGKKKTLFLPKPTVGAPETEMTPGKMKSYKDYKKVALLPDDLFEKLRRGVISEKEFFDERMWENQPDPEITKDQIPHNNIDRLANTSKNLFYTEEYFIRNGGLYFFLKIFDKELEPKLKGVLQFFEHTGFGGDASSGKGSFELEISESDFELNLSDSTGQMNLSLYLPGDEEIQFYSGHPSKVWYQLETRKGKVGGRLFTPANVWKKSVTVFKEGSTFPKISGHQYYGTMPVVKERGEFQDFDVYYNGYALMVDVNLKGA